MEGDPRNPRVSLLKKYDIPVEFLNYDYVEKCTSKKDLERIIRILRSGEEGSYPDLLKFTEDRLRSICPESRVLRVETPILTKDSLTSEQWNAVENELLSWEEEMKVMDKTLDFEKGRIEIVGNNNMPSIRKVAEPSPKTSTQKNKTINDNKNSRIKSGDYAAWDKFDVDRELLKMDVEEERKQEENEKKKREAKKKQTMEKKIDIVDVNKDSYSSMEQQVLANQAKDRGNECYKSGDLETALKYYDISIRLYSTANAYNNRAMTYLKLKKYENAIEDCNKVLHLERNNIKALHRRATAYQNLSDSKDNNYNELALQDLLRMVALEPNNKVAQLDLQKLKKKLNIEDTGKKFRMAISECGQDVGLKQKSGEFGWRDNSISVEKLPLTYYGPSTSTFKCEPFGLVHRALSGSDIPGRVVCRCNSNTPRQNPLCQRCGEAMCTPKISKKSSKPKADIKTNKKEDNEAKNQLLREQSNKNKEVIIDKKEKNRETHPLGEKIIKKQAIEEIETKLDRNNQNFDNNKSKINSVVEPGDNNLKSKEEKPSLVQTLGQTSNKCESVKDLDTETAGNNISGNQIDLNRGSCKGVSVNNAANEKEKKKVEKEESTSEDVKHDKNELADHTEVGCEEKTPEISSSQNEVNSLSKKSRNKKKKSKEIKETLRKHLEPVQIVDPSQYLETKVKPECNDIGRDVNSGKGFVPNNKSSSTENKQLEPPGSTPIAFKKIDSILNDEKISLEGNKENISKNNNLNKAEEEEKESGAEEIRKDLVSSAFEFMKTWEQLKKMDESYAKRAEIIRMIKPSDLGKVIGIKLDSDMLSCLLECLERHTVESDPNIVVEFLRQLPQVPRFGLVSMFLAESDKKKMKRLIERAEGKGFKLEEDVKKALSLTS